MGINIPQLNSCFCFSLKTGAVIAGSLHLVTYLLNAAQITILIMMSVNHLNAKPSMSFRYDVVVQEMLFYQTAIIQTLSDFIVIYGIIKENSSFVMTWILIQTTAIINFAWNMLLLSTMYFHLAYFIEEIIMIGIETMFLWVIFSYYRIMPKHHYTL